MHGGWQHEDASARTCHGIWGYMGCWGLQPQQVGDLGEKRVTAEPATSRARKGSCAHSLEEQQLPASQKHSLTAHPSAWPCTSFPACGKLIDFTQVNQLPAGGCFLLHQKRLRAAASLFVPLCCRIGPAEGQQGQSRTESSRQGGELPWAKPTPHALPKAAPPVPCLQPGTLPAQ